MDIEISQEGTPALRITLEGREIALFRTTLERACYQDTPPGDQQAVLNFAEGLLGVFEGLPRAGEEGWEEPGPES